MVFEAKVLWVLLASPGDLEADRLVMAEAMHQWNTTHSEEQRVVVLPLAWETASTPEVGGRPQEFLNKQLLDRADVVIGAFWSRLGTPTGKAESGTVEELQGAVEQGKEALLYFCETPLAPGVMDPDQLTRLREFKAWAKKNALYHEYKDSAELRRMLEQALSTKVYKLRATWAQQQAVTEMTAPPVEATGAVMGFSSSDLDKVLREAEWAEFVQRQRGHSPLDADLMKSQINDKACLNLTGLGGFAAVSENLRFSFQITNDGKHSAFALQILVERDGSRVVQGEPIRRLDPGGTTRNIELGVRRYNVYADEKPYEEHEFVVKVRFKDGVGEDEVQFVIKVEGHDPQFKIYEDTSRAIFHSYCDYTRPS